MKLKKEQDIKRKFGNNLSNNEIIINDKNRENINNNIQKYALVLKKNYQINNKIKCNNNKTRSKKEIDNQLNNIQTKPNEYTNSYLYYYGDKVIKDMILNEYENVVDYSTNDIFSLQDIQYINQNTRKNIIEKIAFYCNFWKLKDDTIYLTVNIMDRYILNNKINNNEYELIGLTSFFIASKYEDIYPPDASTISKIFPYKCNYIDILNKEIQILQSLDYCFHYISSFKILNLLYYLSEIKDNNVYYFACMTLEFSLIDLNIMKHSQIKRAIACFIFAKKLFGIRSGNNSIKLSFYYEQKEIQIIIRKLFFLLKDIVDFKDKYTIILEKYRSDKFNLFFSSFEKQMKEKFNK